MNSVKKRKKKRQWPYVLLFVIGFIIFLYPQVSRFYYRVESTQRVATFDQEKTEIDDSEIRRRLRLAHDYNDSLINHVKEDPYDKKRHKAGRREYARMLEIHEQIGHIQVPVIDVDIPIYAGADDEVLQKGAGHLEGTSLPVGGNSTHTVITAHSGLPTAKLFSDLSQVKIGDRFYIYNLGEILAYQVDQIKVVVPSNFKNLYIVDGHDYATLLTCTPIMVNTHRLLVRGHRVPYDPSVDRKLMEENQKVFRYKYLFYGILVLILLMLLLIVRYKKLSKGYFIRMKELRNLDKDSNCNKGKE